MDIILGQGAAALGATIVVGTLGLFYAWVVLRMRPAVAGCWEGRVASFLRPSGAKVRPAPLAFHLDAPGEHYMLFPPDTLGEVELMAEGSLDSTVIHQVGAVGDFVLQAD